MSKPFYINDKTLLESSLFARAQKAPLFADLCSESSRLNVAPDEEIIPDLPRTDQSQATRLIIVDSATSIARTAFDFERLSNKLDIDRVLAAFDEIDINLILTHLVFNFYDIIGNTPTNIDGSLVTLDSVDVDLLAGLVSVGFSDPRDIVFHLSIGSESTGDPGVKYCLVAAVKPRLKN